MKLTNLRCAPIPLLFLATMAYAAPPDAPPTDGVPVPQPRVWLGLALAGEGSAPNSVAFVTDAASAAEAGLQAGDVLVNLAGREISGPTDLAEAVSTLRARQTVEAVVTRNGEKTPLWIAPGLLIFLADHTRYADGKKCNQKCRCEVDQPDASCAQLFRYEGEGPNGGVLYTIYCVAVNKDDVKALPGSCTRGPLEFF